jgi:DNA-binding NarL/FixJ family response regulator
LETLKDLKRDYPSLPVIILSMHRKSIRRASFKSRSRGYMNKEAAPDELVAAIKKVYQAANISVRKLRTACLSYRKRSTGRSAQIFIRPRIAGLLLVSGAKTVSQISEELNLSVKTVSTYRTRILEKMNMTTNAELTRYAFDLKLL